MRVNLQDIPIRETLHFLGWRGTPLDENVLEQIRSLSRLALQHVQPCVTVRRFGLCEDGTLEGTAFCPQGEDIQNMLSACQGAMLMAATLGAQAERLLLRTQAVDDVQALVLDAVLSAAIEAVLDEQEETLRKELAGAGLHLTDRYSPGYGDMPLAQTRVICDVLDAQKRIGLTVSANGIMIPRKSVTAIMGISNQPVQRRPKGCAGCQAREYCALRRD